MSAPTNETNFIQAIISCGIPFVCSRYISFDLPENKEQKETLTHFGYVWDEPVKTEAKFLECVISKLSDAMPFNLRWKLRDKIDFQRMSFEGSDDWHHWRWFYVEGLETHVSIFKQLIFFLRVYKRYESEYLSGVAQMNQISDKYNFNNTLSVDREHIFNYWISTMRDIPLEGLFSSISELEEFESNAEIIYELLELAKFNREQIEI